jgi:hypothetical protein
MVAGVRFELTTFGLCDLTQLSLRVGLYLHPPGNEMLAIQSLRLPRSSEAWFGIAALGCISCHDPHVQLRGAEAAEDFRKRCLTCHKVESCRAPFAKRQSTSPPDSCVTCHMPKQQLENISHARQGTPVRTPATYHTLGVSNCFGISAIVPHRKWTNGSRSFGSRPIITSDLEVNHCPRYD